VFVVIFEENLSEIEYRSEEVKKVESPLAATALFEDDKPNDGML
jgi:hypothetical protein